VDFAALEDVRHRAADQFADAKLALGWGVGFFETFHDD